MATVTVSRTLGAEPDAVRAAMADLSAFVAASGFDHVDVADGTVTVRHDVGPATLELVLVVDEAAEAALALDASEGPFERMRTEYRLDPANGGTTVEARTDFELAAPLVGDVLDATVVSRRRRAELESQLDWLERIAG